jgi:hypothetical protein
MKESFVNIAIPGITKLNVKAVAKENAIGISVVQISFKAEMPAGNAGQLIGLQAGGHVIQGSFQAMQANFGKPYVDDQIKIPADFSHDPLPPDDKPANVETIPSETESKPVLNARQQAARDREARKRLDKRQPL